MGRTPPLSDTVLAWEEGIIMARDRIGDISYQTVIVYVGDIFQTVDQMNIIYQCQLNI